ncbi:MAG TPA: hypothetical protein VK475_10740, partial [Pyrinomonadaceae bacterium]|nr:hypothetical protein [Pyrinomonadaceae bacterium]
MRFTTLLLLTLVLLSLSGCGNDSQSVTAPQTAKRSADSRAELAENQSALKTEQSALTHQSVSLNQADAANIATQAIERKII